MQISTVSIMELAQGDIQEKFEESFKKVMENLLDPNCPSDGKREITIKLKFTQNPNRDEAVVDVAITEKLTPQIGIKTMIGYKKDINGNVVVDEF